MKTLMEEIAANTGLALTEVDAVLGKVFAHIHRCFYEGERVQINGDYVGEGLRWDIGAEAYFHFVGILYWLARTESYREPGEVGEYALRTFSPEDRERFNHQMDNWKPRAGFE